MRKFKVGEGVRVVECGAWTGMIGVILAGSPMPWCESYLVSVERWLSVPFSAEELEAMS